MSEFVPPGKRCTICDRRAIDPADTHPLCETHAARLDERDCDTEASAQRSNSPETHDRAAKEAANAPFDAQRGVETSVERVDSWGEASFLESYTGEYLPEHLEMCRWMGRVGKKPFAPWGDANPDDAEPDDSPRWEWGRTENYVDGETVAIAEDDPRLDGRVFLQRHADPYAFVDGDNIRDPETGDVHPEFLEILERLGVTYADISTSGAGIHAYYRGELPRGLPEAKWSIDDEPYGANDDAPAVEIYANKHVCVATGDRVRGTPLQAAEWDTTELEAVLDEWDQLPEESRSTDPDDYDLDDYEPKATGSDKTTDDIRDVFRALDRLDPKRVAERTIVREWTRDRRGFLPVWGNSDDSGTANYVDDRIWHDTGHDGGYGGPVVMAAIDAGLIGHTGAEPSDVRGATFFEAVDHLRDLGFSIPRLEASDEPEGETESGRDLLELDVVVEPAEAMRAARAVEPADLDRDLPELQRDDVDDVAIAVALADGLIDDAGTFPRDDGYTQSYYRARDVFGAPLPRYLDNSTLAERFDLVSAAVGRVGPEHILDELQSEIVEEDPSGQAIAKIDPVWEETEGSGRIVAGYGAGFWCAEHDDVGSFSPLQLAALEHGIIDDESAYPTGEGYKQAYRLLREEYGAPLPRWRATILEEVPVLPPAVRVLDDDLSATSSVDLERAREETEELVRDALTTRDRAQLVTVVPGGGKTFSTAIVADDEPVLYAPPRNELKEQMEEYAEEVSMSDTIDADPTAYHLPILAENQLGDDDREEDAIDAGLRAIREDGAGLLRDREELLERVETFIESPAPASDSAGGVGADDSDDDDEVDLDRAVCPAADGDHGEEWRVALQVARARGLTPSTLHQYDRALFGDELPCQQCGECEYTAGWDVVRDPASCPDILIGSPGHAFVDSATSYYREDGDGHRETEPRAVVIDEFPGDTYASEYGERYMDHAVWLGEALVGVENREELLAAGLNTDTWVDHWIRGEAAELVTAGEAIDALWAGSRIIDAVETAENLLNAQRDLGAVASGSTSANLGGLTDALEELVDSDPEGVDPEAIADTAGVAAERLRRDADRAYADGHDSAGDLYSLADTLVENIRAPLTDAADELDGESLADAIDQRTATLPIAGDLQQLIDDAVDAAVGDAPRELLEAATEALRGGRDGCRALAVAAEDGYAHPDAWSLLAGAIAKPGDDGVAVGSQRTLSFEDGGEGLQHKSLTVNGADVHADRDHHGAVVFDRPAFTSADGDTCPLVGLDATARRELWRIALGRDAQLRDIHETVTERRRHIREGMNHTVVQTANTPLSYHGDPEGRNFQEDLAVIRSAAEEYSDLDEKGPAVISTLKVLKHLSDDLDDLADETVNYENMRGSGALGNHQVAVVLGSQHFGDSEPERWAMYAGESADRGDTFGAALDYDSEVANTYLKHMQEDATMQAILRAGRNDDRSVAIAHTSALREDLPVVAEGATVSAHSKGTLAVADAAAEFTHRSFTAADVAERIQGDDRGVGIRQVQNILANLRSDGYLRVETDGKRGREYEYSLESDPGLADVQLPGPEDVGTEDTGDAAGSKTKNELLDTYSWNFGFDADEEPNEGVVPPSRAPIPATDTAETLENGG